MHEKKPNPDILFSPGDWVVDLNNPASQGKYTGHWRMAGPHLVVQLSYPDGSTSFRPLACLEAVRQNGLRTIEERLTGQRFGKIRDLQRLIYTAS
jgi:hypothetical protein